MVKNQHDAMSIENKTGTPIIWYSTSNFKIMDLHDNHYDEVMTLIKHHYLAEEPMCKSIEILQDPTSVSEYLNLIKTWIKDTCSLVAISAKSGRVVGVIVTRINSFLEKSNTFSRVQVFEGESLQAIMSLKSSLISQANEYEKFGHDTYLRIHLISIHPSYKSKGVAKALLEACNLLAVNMQMPVVAGIFTSNEYQKLAYNLGYLPLSEIFYKNWIIDEEIVFDDPGVGNFSAAFMFLKTLDTNMIKDKNLNAH